jgi:hypothetical protein
MHIPNRRALPTLFVSNDEYQLLDEIATERKTTVADLLRELVASLVEAEGRVVVLQIPDETYASFAAFFDDEPVEDSMARCLSADGDDFGRAVKKAQARTGSA